MNKTVYTMFSIPTAVFPAESFAPLGLDADKIQRAVNEILSSPDTILRRISNYIIFTRLIRNLTEQTARDIDEDAVLNRVDPGSDRHYVQQSIRGLKRYVQIATTITPVNVEGTARIVEQFVHVFNTGIISLPKPFDAETSFPAKLLSLVYPNAKEQISEVINTVGVWVKDPLQIPECNFLVNTLLRKIHAVYQNPHIQEAGKAEFLQQFMTSVAEDGQGKTDSSTATSVQNVIDIIGGAYDTVVETFNSNVLDRGFVVNSVLLVLLPLVQAVASTSPSDHVIWDTYKSLLCGNIMKMEVSDWLALKDRLALQSPVFAKFYALCGEHINTLMELRKTYDLIN